MSDTASGSRSATRVAEIPERHGGLGPRCAGLLDAGPPPPGPGPEQVPAELSRQVLRSEPALPLPGRGDTPGRWAALQRPAAPSTVRSGAAARLVDLTFAVLRGYPVPDGELVHVTRMLGATINGFLALERAGSYGHRDPDVEISWQRTLSALDTILRTWPTPPPPPPSPSVGTTT